MTHRFVPICLAMAALLALGACGSGTVEVSPEGQTISDTRTQAG